MDRAQLSAVLSHETQSEWGMAALGCVPSGQWQFWPRGRQQWALPSAWGAERASISACRARLNELVEEGKLEKEDVQSRPILEALKGEQAAGGHPCPALLAAGRPCRQ